MQVEKIPVAQIDVSESNVRKNLLDGEADSTVEDLARSIERLGLLSPILVHRKSDGRYALIVGQRRLLAHRYLGCVMIDAPSPGRHGKLRCNGALAGREPP